MIIKCIKCIRNSSIVSGQYIMPIICIKQIKYPRQYLANSSTKYLALLKQQCYCLLAYAKMPLSLNFVIFKLFNMLDSIVISIAPLPLYYFIAFLIACYLLFKELLATACCLPLQALFICLLNTLLCFLKLSSYFLLLLLLLSHVIILFSLILLGC